MDAQSNDSPDTVVRPERVELYPGIAARQRQDNRWVADPDEIVAAAEAPLPSIGTAAR